MKVKYIKENNTYVLTSHVVARNTLFVSGYYTSRFLVKFEEYLGPLCKLLSYSLSGEEFTMVVKVFGRPAFIDYYVRKKERSGKDVSFIPESTYIFSQAMANLLSGMVIHFNRKEGRTGAMFARRFQKILIVDQERLDYWIDRIHKKIKTHTYQRRWRSREGRKKRRRSLLWNSKEVFEFMDGKRGRFGQKLLDCLNDLQGQSKIHHFLTRFLIENQSLPVFSPP